MGYEEGPSSGEVRLHLSTKIMSNRLKHVQSMEAVLSAHLVPLQRPVHLNTKFIHHLRGRALRPGESKQTLKPLPAPSLLLKKHISL